MTTVRVIYADTDMGGVVYHGTYLRWFEQARTEQLYGLGIDLAALHLDHHLVFTITEVTIRYHQPAGYGDVLDIEVYPVRIGPARCDLGYEVRRPSDGAVCVTGRTTFAALDAATGKVVRMPEVIRRQLQAALDERTAAARAAEG